MFMARRSVATSMINWAIASELIKFSMIALFSDLFESLALDSQEKKFYPSDGTYRSSVACPSCNL